MSKYISENELDTFSLHDCHVKDAYVKGNDVIWILSHIDVKTDNSCNTYPTAMQTSSAKITFYDCKYEEGTMHYALGCEPEYELLNDNDKNTVNSIIKDCSFNGLSFEDGIAEFEIIQADYLFTYKVLYSRVTVEWEEFDGKTWYARRAEELKKISEYEQEEQLKNCGGLRIGRGRELA